MSNIENSHLQERIKNKEGADKLINYTSAHV